MKPRCAVYARYSSDRQSASSIADQVRKCREYAQARGWQVLNDHVYSDEAISGATADRAGLKGLLAAAETKAFEIVLVDDTSRLSRKLADSINFSECLQFFGVRIVFVSQGIDSESEQAEVLLATHGIVDSLYIRELGKKTFRGVEGRVLERRHHGGRVFGYRSVPIEDPVRRDTYGRALIVGAHLRIESDQAEIVRKIFSLYAAGLSIKAVAKELNAERVISPQPREGRQQSWAPSSIRVILRNERYRGVVTWAKTKKIRNPQTGRRVKRVRPESEWVRVETPELRIVPEKLWLAVQGRLEHVNRVFGEQGRKGGLMNSRAVSSPYIFSGLLRCGECGASYVIVSGNGRNHGGADYGCSAHSNRGTCANARRLKREVLENELLAKLRDEVLSEDAVDYLVGRLQEEIEKRYAALDSEMESMRRRKAELENKVKNLVRLVEDGMDSPSVRASITAHEAELASLTARTLGVEKGSVHTRVSDLRKFVRESLGNIRELLAGKYTRPVMVRQELARHIEAITLLPDGNRDMRYKGEWKLLGGTDGAEGQS